MAARLPADVVEVAAGEDGPSALGESLDVAVRRRIPGGGVPRDRIDRGDEVARLTADGDLSKPARSSRRTGRGAPMPADLNGTFDTRGGLVIHFVLP